MAKVWVLDTDTKGTGAQVVPLEEAIEKTKAEDSSAARARRRRAESARKADKGRPRAPKPESPGTTWSSPLAPGQVRKKATGEIGKVRSVDPRAGTATVLWLRQGRTSTVPLTAISRR